LGLHDPGYPPFIGEYDHIWKVEGNAYEVAQVRYSVWCPQLSIAQAEMRAFLNAFGVEWDPRIIWDAIPWSFVIDWFISIGDWIDSWDAKRAALPLYARIHDMSITRRVKIRSEVRFRWVKDLYGMYDSHIVRCEGTHYSRKTAVQVAPTKDDLQTAGFTSFETRRLLNGLALVTVNTAGPDKVAPRVGNANRNARQKFEDGENLPKNRKPKSLFEKFGEAMNMGVEDLDPKGFMRLTPAQRQLKLLERRLRLDAKQGKLWRKAGANPIAPGLPGPKLPRKAVQVNRGYLRRQVLWH